MDSTGSRANDYGFNWVPACQSSPRLSYDYHLMFYYPI